MRFDRDLDSICNHIVVFFFPTWGCQVIKLVSFYGTSMDWLWKTGPCSENLTVSLSICPLSLLASSVNWCQTVEFLYSFGAFNGLTPTSPKVQKDQTQMTGSPCVLQKLWNTVTDQTDIKSRLGNYLFIFLTYSLSATDKFHWIWMWICNYSFNPLNMHIVTLK